MRRRGLVVVVVLCLIAVGCSRDDKTADTTTTAAGGSTTPTSEQGGVDCSKETPKATEIGVTADKITIEVMADTGSPAAPGLFQGNIDGTVGFAKYINEHGGIACRQLEVKTWDTKLSSDESKNGQIDACQNALAMVGSNALFSPDNGTLVSCKDKAGEATGLPDLAALAADSNQACNPTTFLIQAVTDDCGDPPKVPTGERDIKAIVGPTKYYASKVKDLHGAYIIPGDLPTTVQASMPQKVAQEAGGITWDNLAKTSGLAEQSAYTPIIQKLRSDGSNYVFNGSNDKAMVNARKEAKAQGLDSIKLWACTLACYSPQFLSSGGADVDGTYAWFQFLPFEDKGSNDQLDAFLDTVKNPDSWGAQSWQAAVTFKDLVDGIVKKDGVNGITRASLLDALKNAGEVDAGGWMGPKSLRGVSNCFVIMQVDNGAWKRVFPTEKGKLDCSDDNLTTVSLDPAAEAAKIK